MPSCYSIALVAGHFREIPFWWRLVDSAFGFAGMILLGICLQKIKKLEKEEKEEAERSRMYDFSIA